MPDFGIMIHTTGDGPPSKALKEGISPTEAALAIYDKMHPVGPHYLIGPDGDLHTLRPTTEKALHCGVSSTERRDFLTGHWQNKLPKNLVTWWKERFPGVKSPSHLYPSRTANEDYIGIELIPCGTWPRGRGSWTPVFGRPFLSGGRFTGAQYMRLAYLVLDIAAEKGILLDKTGRLVGHEDVNPLTREGWDPGAYRGYFDWAVLRSIMEGIRRHEETK